MGTDILTEKWAPVIEHNDLPSVTDREKKAVLAQVLENTEHADTGMIPHRQTQISAHTHTHVRTA